jgi:hypothetical protein
MRKVAQRRQRGQALVEFSLAIMVFLVMLMGIFDVGRAIFTYNGVSEAAREIARRTSVHPYLGLAENDNMGSSLEAVEAIQTQRRLVPGMEPVAPGAPNFECVDIDGNPSVNTACGYGEHDDYVKVTVTATYRPITLLGITGPITLKSTSTAAIP